MAKVQSFRWSRLAERSAWERMRSRLSVFLFGLCFVCVMCNWWANFWMLGLPLLLLATLFVVCTADDYCRVACSRYYFYKNDDHYIMEVLDYSGCYTIEVVSWEYENIPEQGMVLLYCDDGYNWNIVSRNACMRLGNRINKSSFLMNVTNIHGGEEKRLVVLSEGHLHSYIIRDVYAGNDLRVCFTRQEKDYLSENEIKADYMVAKRAGGGISIWRIKNGKSFFAAESIDLGPSLIIRKEGRVSILVFEYEVYRYKEIYNDEVEALAVSGRFVNFKEGGFPFYATVFEFDPEVKEVKEIYAGSISSMDFETGEYTV